MIVVSDTSCVTNLLAIGRAMLLRELFGEVVIPSAVARALRVAHAALPDFIREQSVKDSSRAHALAIEPLDEGEAEASSSPRNCTRITCSWMRLRAAPSPSVAGSV